MAHVTKNELDKGDRFSPVSTTSNNGNNMTDMATNTDYILTMNNSDKGSKGITTNFYVNTSSNDNAINGDLDNTPVSGSTHKSRSKPSSGVSEMLLSRANTMLKTATLKRNSTQMGSSQIKDTLKTLEREKTRLDLAVTHNGNDVSDHEDMDVSMTKPDKQPTDSDYDTDLEDDPSLVSEPAERPKILYKKTCKKLGIRPVPYVIESVETKEVQVLNRCLNALDILSLTNALISNRSVTRLILDGNNIRDEGAQLIAWLMKTRETRIERLSLADNGIGPEGFGAIGEMLHNNRQIISLNISGNRTGDDEIKIVAKALKKNHILQTLNLSFNGIGDMGARYLAAGIASNEGLSSLDLSWNKIRPEGGVAICNAIRENVKLKTLNLSMNGLSTTGATRLGETLTKNDTLTYLDITYNRIYDEGAAHIAKGLQQNEKLHHLIMHHNPLTSAGAMTLLSAIRSNEQTAMWKLDLSSVPIIKDVATAYEEYHERNDGFQFKHGLIVDSENAIVGDMNSLNNRHPMAMVRDYIEEEGLRLIDFFKIMDKDHGGSISRDEFVQGLQHANVPITRTQLQKLIGMLDKDGDGEIDYRELVEGDKEFRRERLKKKIKAIEAMNRAMKTQQKKKPFNPDDPDALLV